MEKVTIKYDPIYVCGDWLDINSVLCTLYEGRIYYEEWKQVKGYEGCYDVSSFGRIKSIGRVIVMKNGFNKTVKEKLRSVHYNKKNYVSSTIYKEGKSSTKEIHVISAVAFLGHEQTGAGGLVVDHMDNDPSNNFIKNLQLITNRQNSKKDKFRLNISSLYPGVYINKNRFHVSIRINGEKVYLGTYKDELVAAKAYEDAELCVNEGRVEDVKVVILKKSSKYKGVCFANRDSDWMAFYYSKGKTTNLGHYSTEEEAKSVRDAYVKKLENE